MIGIWDRFRRITTTGNYIPEIDGLRCVAIALVLFNHLASILFEQSEADYSFSNGGELMYWVIRRGGIGVLLFFSISGFILALPFLKHHLYGGKPVLLGNYFLRRVTRLEPPYIIVLCIYFVMLVGLGQYGFFELLPNFLASLIYQHNIIFGENSLVNGVAWSLEIEVQFYVLVPFVIGAIALRSALKRRLLLVTLIIATAVGNGYWHGPTCLLDFLQYFLVGFLFADLFLAGKLTGQHWAWDLLLFVIVVITYIQLRSSFIPIPDDLVRCGAFATIFFAAFRGVWFRRLMRVPLVTVLGGMCYSIYLLHAQIIGLFVRKIYRTFTLGMGYWPDYLLLCLILVPIILVISGIFFLLIERPCMRPDWPQRLYGFFRQNVFGRAWGRADA